MFDQKPRIKLTLSFWDRTLEKASIVLLLFFWGFTLFAYLKLPDIIPTHFNFKGIVDAYGNKFTLFMLPSIATIIYVVISILIRNPHVLNYPTAITSTNAAIQYSYATRLLRFIKIAILFIFAATSLVTYLAATGIISSLGKVFLPLVLSLIIFPTIYYVRKSIRAQ